jgi:poly(A) polymerase Pap1
MHSTTSTAFPFEWVNVQPAPAHGDLHVHAMDELDEGESSSCAKELMHCVDLLVPSSADDRLRKIRVIRILARIVNRWVRAITHRRTEGRVVYETATILVGGSWRLGVDSAKSDLDIVCLVPDLVRSEDFFRSLPRQLERWQGVSELVVISAATVPRMTFRHHGVLVDLLLCRFSNATKLPDPTKESGGEKRLEWEHQHPWPALEKTVACTSFLKGLDVPSAMSVNGPRAVLQIMQLLPSESKNAYKKALRAVRVWAQRRLLYCNKVGFLGGINWAILMAWVCQRYPKETCPVRLFLRLLGIFALWQWPKPVLLCPLTRGHEVGMEFTQWDPAMNVRDQHHIMPIITPGYPAINSSVNVCASTLRVMQREFMRGDSIVKQLHKREREWCQARTEERIARNRGKSISVGGVGQGSDSRDENSEGGAGGAGDVEVEQVEEGNVEAGEHAAENGVGDSWEQENIWKHGWLQLFEPTPFFEQYQYYLAVDVSIRKRPAQREKKAGGSAGDSASDSAGDSAGDSVHDLDRYTGYLSSRLRKLITALEFEAAVSASLF